MRRREVAGLRLNATIKNCRNDFLLEAPAAGGFFVGGWVGDVRSEFLPRVGC